MERPPGQRTCLYDKAQLERVVEAMGRQLAALVDEPEALVLVGILRRGAPLADRLAGVLASRHGFPPPMRLDLSIKRYADDLSLLFPDTRFEENAAHRSLDLSDRCVVIVDDVLYTGHSLLRAVTYMASKKPRVLRVATLADRCVAALPLHADVVGLRLAVAPTDVVECNVPPYEPDFRIELLRPERT